VATADAEGRVASRSSACSTTSGLRSSCRKAGSR
jgi:hypothetical protein